jgi:uncharacterized protein YndB with AHSA1/START domain
MFLNTLIVVAALAIVFLVIVALQPSRFRVARSAVIDAPAATVFGHVNDFRKWEAWSPYEGRDPAMKKTFEGPPAGTGASYAWSGNNQVGEGRSTITDSRPNERITIRLEFIRPFAATNTAEFTFKPQQGGRTEVTWALSGDKNFMSKAVCMFMNMDKMVGGDFEKGLAKLKAVAEAAPAAAPAATAAHAG